MGDAHAYINWTCHKGERGKAKKTRLQYQKNSIYKISRGQVFLKLSFHRLERSTQSLRCSTSTGQITVCTRHTQMGRNVKPHTQKHEMGHRETHTKWGWYVKYRHIIRTHIHFRWLRYPGRVKSGFCCHDYTTCLSLAHTQIRTYTVHITQL